ncbi:UL46 tegument phosphoprotein [Meleagrid alphaherpesvirus 1]|uniref:UL46 tegument phosphoprotein n=1 Tax=Meleagrid herpesvirus 1 TaxID=37108 RepID=Q9DH38_MEHV1|nr:tegument protein VP11/12 [Meleagrid alphaherpesvirus 1]AKQ48607.1 tegument protein VP11/12 [iBAC vector pMeHV1-C7]AKQ48679.1 tegument protein VP11/12 [iBAC vector pMeHV1-C9]AKQ48751.1 tegument protein VP11/12 [iBAC vector pMeHV1-C10]AKQ48823.1 tegument protein VP11/12 [iBAC vector pMeHV1-C17]AKQ48896.1 tegument protein VP11/12 [iBAC vector pMeHV1-C18]
MEKRMESNCTPPFGLDSKFRQSVLRDTTDNGVPEYVVLRLALGDAVGQYMHRYMYNIKRRLKRAKLSRSEVKRHFLAAYNSYFCERHSIPYTETRDPTERGKAALALLFYPTIYRDPLVENPFKCQNHNLIFRNCWTSLRNLFDMIQRYAYYMRPDKIGEASSDTSARLELLLSYVVMLYKWMLWLVDTLDMTTGSKFIACRYTGDVGESLKEFMEEISSLPSDKWSSTSLLCRIIGNVIAPLLQTSVLWSQTRLVDFDGDRNSRAILAVVSLVSLLNHHCQYLINLTQRGYVIWLDGNTENTILKEALLQQDQFEHQLGNLFPSMLPVSWGALECSINTWFGRAATDDVKLSKNALALLGIKLLPKRISDVNARLMKSIRKQDKNSNKSGSTPTHQLGDRVECGCGDTVPGLTEFAGAGSSSQCANIGNGLTGAIRKTDGSGGPSLASNDPPVSESGRVSTPTTKYFHEKTMRGDIPVSKVEHILRRLKVSSE